MKEKPSLSTGTDMSSLVSDPSSKSVLRDMQTRAAKNDQQIDDKIKEMEALKAPEMPKMPDAPKQSDYSTDPMKTWGSAAMMVGALGSLFTRHPMITALNSAAAVNKAAAAGDANAYKNAMDKWKIDSEYAMKKNNYELDAYKAAVSKGTAEINAHSKAFKDDVAARALDMRDNENHLKDRERQMKMMEEGYKLQNLQFQNKYAEMSVQLAKAQAAKEGKPFTEQDGYKIYNESLGSAKGEQGGKVSKDVQAANIAKTDWASLKDTDQVGNSGLTLAAVKQAAETVKNTGDFSKAGLGVGWNAAKMAVDNYMGYAYPNINRAALGLDYIAQKKAANVIGADLGGMEAATNKLDSVLPILERKINILKPDRFPTLNAAENYANEHSGEPEYVGLREALQGARGAYQQLIAKGGQVTDSVRAKADDQLNAAWNKGQFVEAFKTMRETGQAELKADKKALRDLKNLGVEEDKSEKQPIEASPQLSPSQQQFVDKAKAEGHTDEEIQDYLRNIK